jgi:hypothetical protein
MNYPDRVKLKDLEVTREEYREHLDVWGTIQDLRRGASHLVKKASVYLPRKPGEEQAVYQNRLDKFCYTPVLNTAIREYVAKLSSAPIAKTGMDPASTFWASFLNNIDGSGANEKEFLTGLFANLLYYRDVYLVLDRPILGPLRSRLEDEQNKAYPVLKTFGPLNVPNWGDGWYQTRQFYSVAEPLQPSKKMARWTYYDATVIAVYEAEVSLNASGAIEKVYTTEQPKGVVPSKAIIPLTRVAPHGLGKVPVTKLSLPEELWVGNAAYLKQLQHIWIENAWTEAGSIAGQVQRVFKPQKPVPSDDPTRLYEEPDYSGTDFGNPYVLVGDGFEFAESSGSAIANLTGQLETIEQHIRDIVSMGFLSASRGRGSVTQSGFSKEMDMTLLQDSMAAYGSKVAQLYEDSLKMVAIAAATGEEPTVTGLDNYTANTLDGMTGTTATMLPFIESLPQTARRLWFKKMSNLMVGTISPEEQGLIDDELETISLEPVATPEKPATMGV